MNQNNINASIIALYLSKYDTDGIHNLGFLNQTEAFDAVSKATGAKKNYIKLRRDEFDVFFSWRHGWRRIVSYLYEIFNPLSEPDFRALALKLISSNSEDDISAVQEISTFVSSKRKPHFFSPSRIITGKLAEDFFIKSFNAGSTQFRCKLIDKRHAGCGYDFEIDDGNKIIYIEIKGISKDSGSILFSNKEWATAKRLKEKFLLCIVENVNKTPKIKYIQNPIAKLSPKRIFQIVAQTSWTISSDQLQD